MAVTNPPPAEESAALSHEQNLWRWRILISTYLGYAGFYLTRKVFTICKTSIAGEFDWDLNATANIWTAYLVAYVIGQFVNSFLGRRWGPRVLLLGGLGLSMACNVVFGFSNSFASFMIFMFFNGLVQAAGWPGSVGGVAQWLRPSERGWIMGIWSTNYLVGNIVVKALGGYLLGHLGWRWSFWGCTLVSFAIWWVIYFWQRDKPEDVNLPPIVDKDSLEIRSVKASHADRISLLQYGQLLFNPVVLAMGASYFCVKFLRYALDSWLPSFFNILGLSVERSSYYSLGFDIFGLAGAILAGWALDRHFKGNWARLCFLMSLGMIIGYGLVLFFGNNILAQVVCFSVVGLMIYGPDTLLAGAASVQVAGEKNGIAVAGIVNGIASMGPVVQEKLIGGWMKGKDNEALKEGIHKTNLLALSMSILFAFLMLIVMWRLGIAHRKPEEPRGAAGSPS